MNSFDGYTSLNGQNAGPSGANFQLRSQFLKETASPRLQVQQSVLRQTSFPQADQSISDYNPWKSVVSVSEGASKPLDLMDWLTQEKKSLVKGSHKNVAINFLLNNECNFRSSENIYEERIRNANTPNAENSLKATLLEIKMFKIEYQKYQQKYKSGDPTHTSVSVDGPSTSQTESGHTSVQKQPEAGSSKETAFSPRLQMQQGVLRQTASSLQEHPSISDFNQRKSVVSVSEVASKPLDLMDWLLRQKADGGEIMSAVIDDIIKKDANFESAISSIMDNMSNQKRITRNQHILHDACQERLIAVWNLKNKWEQQNKSGDPIPNTSVSVDGPSTSQTESGHTSVQKQPEARSSKGTASSSRLKMQAGHRRQTGLPRQAHPHIANARSSKGTASSSRLKMHTGHRRQTGLPRQAHPHIANARSSKGTASSSRLKMNSNLWNLLVSASKGASKPLDLMDWLTQVGNGCEPQSYMKRTINVCIKSRDFRSAQNIYNERISKAKDPYTKGSLRRCLRNIEDLQEEYQKYQQKYKSGDPTHTSVSVDGPSTSQTESGYTSVQKQPEAGSFVPQETMDIDDSSKSDVDMGMGNEEGLGRPNRARNLLAELPFPNTLVELTGAEVKEFFRNMKSPV